jgi:hypothetical protein
LQADLSNNEYYIKFADLSKEVDKELTLHRIALLDVSNGNNLENMYTLEATYTLKFPFSEVSQGLKPPSACGTIRMLPSPRMCQALKPLPYL